jgi:predicted transcriptional regulator
VSALDTVQAVEQLEDNASQVAVNMLEYLRQRTRKSYNRLMADALHFAADITRPLFEGVSAVKYTRQARILKVAQDYAERLLQPRFQQEEAEAIARALVRNYAAHGFVIDRKEAENMGEMESDDSDGHGNGRPIGLHVSDVPNEKARHEIDWLQSNMTRVAAFGYLVDYKKTEARQ